MSVRSEKYLLLCLLGAAVLSCKERSGVVATLRATPSDTEEIPQIKSEDLGASDVSILVPLKPSRATSDNDPFHIEGDGFVNALKLDFGEFEPILSKELFQKFADDVYGNALDSADAAQPERGTCLAPKISESLRWLTDRELLAKSAHVSLVRLLDKRICNFENWRVIGLRWDPCLDRPNVLDLHKWVGGMPTACKMAEVRLVAQPFVKSQGTWVALDTSIHLIFQAPNIPGLVKYLRNLKKASIEAPMPAWEPLDDKDPWLLRPHPGLRAEMGAHTPGAVGKAYRELLQEFTRERLLTGIAWMTSSLSLTHWSFGTRRIVSRALVPATRFEAESFSMAVLSQKEFPISPLDGSSLNVTSAFGQSTSTSITDAIENPLKVSQILAGQQSSTCISCHMSRQGANAIHRRLGLSNSDVTSNAYFLDEPFVARPSHTQPRVWRGFGKNGGTLDSLRNFGYGPGFSFAISSRALFETDDLVATIARNFPDRGDVAEGVQFPGPGGQAPSVPATRFTGEQVH